jgi:hypothetical protein
MNKEQEELLDEAYENFVKSIENNRPEGYVRKVMTKYEFMKESNFNKDLLNQIISGKKMVILIIIILKIIICGLHILVLIFFLV